MSSRLLAAFWFFYKAASAYLIIQYASPASSSFTSRDRRQMNDLLDLQDLQLLIAICRTIKQYIELLNNNSNWFELLSFRQEQQYQTNRLILTATDY